MKKVFSSMDSAEIGMLKTVLDEAGIVSFVRNDAVSRVLPGVLFQPELCVIDDADYAKARELCEDWRHPAAATSGSWTCAQCGERSEGQFTSCWKCGTEKPAAE
ncbi:MAG: DUF2007 domain-containing protein [Verrucomicrobiaceae bacterium]